MTENRLVKNLWFAYAVALAVWGASAYVELGRICKENELLATMVQNEPRVSDFAVFYNAAKLARENSEHKIEIYSPAVQEESLKTVTAPVVAKKPLFAVYPPWFFGLVMPLSSVPPVTAWVIWCALGAAALVGTLIFLTSKLDQFKTPFSKFFGFAAVLGSYPCWASFRLGQVSLFLPAAITAFWYLLFARRYFLAGIVSGACMLKIQYLPLLAIVGAIMGRARYIGGLALSLAALFVFSLATVGMDNIVQFPTMLHFNETSAQAGGVSAELMQNFRGMLTLLLGGDTSDIRMAALVILGVLAVSISELWWRSKKLGLSEKKLMKCAAVTTLTMLIGSPHTHIQDYLAAAPALFWLWQSTAGDERAASVYLRRAIIAFPALSWAFFLLMPIFQLVRIEPYFIWAVALSVMTLVVIDDETLTLESVQKREAAIES